MSSFWTVYKSQLKYSLRYKWQYFGSWITGFLLIFANNITIFAIGGIIDSVKTGQAALTNSIVLIAISLSAPLILDPLTMWLRTTVSTLSQRDSMSDIYRSVLNLDYNFHTKRQTGKLISTILTAQESVTMFTWQFEWHLLANIATLLIPIILIAIIKVQLALVLIIVIVVSLPILNIIMRFNIKARRNLKEAEYTRNTQIVDGISNYETVRIFGRENEEVQSLNTILENCKSVMNKYTLTFRAIDVSTRFAGVALFTAGAFFAYNYYQQEVITLGGFVVVVSYLIQLITRIENVIYSLRDIFKSLPLAEDYFDLIGQKSIIKESANPAVIANPKGEINFKDVSFTYENERKVICDLNIHIEPNQNVAFVGPSGGGKTTLIKLILRYYDLTHGSIQIDGVDIKDLSIAQLKSLIGIVPQEPVLFNKSILFNVGYALSTDINTIQSHKDEIIEACKQAQIHTFIETLHDGYDTIVGERGIKLSGGQKQRIAIARVLLKKAKIVVFDEATSMLDSESEQAIQKAFRALSADKTTIIIAHRLSTVIHCDKIFVIDKGCVKEAGTHAELLKINGIYANLWNIQSGGFSKQ